MSPSLVIVGALVEWIVFDCCRSWVEKASEEYFTGSTIHTPVGTVRLGSRSVVLVFFK